MGTPTNRGWREGIAPGIYRQHTLRCPSSTDHRPGRRCGCPWAIAVSGPTGSTLKALPGSATLTEVKRARRRSLATGRPATPKPEAESLRQFTASYLSRNEARLSPFSHRGYNDEYRRRIDPTFGHVPVASITRRQVEGWLATLDPSSAHRSLRVLRLILSDAVRSNLITTNPAMGIRLPPPPEARSRVLTEDNSSGSYPIPASRSASRRCSAPPPRPGCAAPRSPGSAGRTSTCPIT
jgi:Phage integrase, N-terminal SAM-like domain